MRRLATALAVTALFTLSACGGDGSRDTAADAPSDGAPSPSASASSAAGTPTQPAATRAVTVYYVGDSTRGLRLFTEQHQRPATQAVVRDAVEAVLTDPPADPDYKSLWPAGTTVRGVSLAGDTATVDLSAEAARNPGAGAEAEEMSLQQLVWTVTGAAPAVKRVRLHVDGRSVETLWGHSDTSKPIARAEPAYTVLAAVQIEKPGHGATVGSPVQVAGVATVFEATVSWEVLRGATVVKKGFVTASEGGPGRGTWSVAVELPPGTYTLRAFEASAENGKATNIDTKQFTVS